MTPDEQKNDMYVGQKKVKDNQSLDKKLPTGEDLFQVDYEDGTSEVLTRQMFEASISTEPMNEDDLWNSRSIAITSQIMTLLLNWGVKFELIDSVLDKISYSFKMNMKEVTDEMKNEVFDRIFGKKMDDITVIDLDEILRTGSYKQKQTVADVVSPDSEKPVDGSGSEGV